MRHYEHVSKVIMNFRRIEKKTRKEIQPYVHFCPFKVLKVKVMYFLVYSTTGISSMNSTCTCMAQFISLLVFPLLTTVQR